MVKFHFACYALCEMNIEHLEEGDDPIISAELCSFHLTVDDAQAEADAINKQHLEAHREHNRKYSYMRYREFEPSVFQIVPLNELQFRYLGDGEDMIEQAAILRQKGCGVTA